MIHTIYHIDQLAELIPDLQKVSDLWNSKQICNHCRMSLKYPKYYNDVSDKIYCDHNQKYYLLTESMIQSLLDLKQDEFVGYDQQRKSQYKYFYIVDGIIYKILRDCNEIEDPKTQKKIIDLKDSEFQKTL